MTTQSMKPAHPPIPSDQEASGRTFAYEEMDALAEVILRGTLTSTKGSFTRNFEQNFARRYGAGHAYACSSGTAALHTAYAALNPEPGDEFITTPITDMGAISPILYQGAIPVFADVDPTSCNVTAETIERVISKRTRAIVVTHLFGNPCNMREIMELARNHNIAVVEDCAQAFLAKFDGQYVGTFGDIGCFSLQQGKHMTTGEGGVVLTDDEDLARRMFLFINKAWGYGDTNPDHYFLALNYRMTELQGAVACAQLPKLEGVVQKRRDIANKLTQRLQSMHGIQTPIAAPSAEHAYWKYCLNVDATIVAGGAEGLGQELRKRGIACAPRYIQKPAFECQVFRDQQTFGSSKWPFTLARPAAVDYNPERFLGTYRGLAQVLVLPINENYTAEHVDLIANAIQEALPEQSRLAA